jgi:tRNA nucleotidyltransferase (CCA-adding enzyme)
VRVQPAACGRCGATRKTLMKTYVVGGAVRDELLGVPVKDRDHVVIGATPEDMVRRGFRPVGRDFPVFLHPETHEEYALARTERKTARGYRGFEFYAAPEVTLEQDLARRDLTINAIARDDVSGELIDPFQGAQDLAAGILRHVSPAFEEDPVRLLRVARFVARYGFEIAPETQELMRRMVERGEADALVPERVWQEIARGLMEHHPSPLFEVLHECGALARVAPELEALFRDGRAGEGLAALDAAAQANEPLEVRWAALGRVLPPPALERLAERLRMPSDCRELALLAARHGQPIAAGRTLTPAAMLSLLDSTDAWRRPERFRALSRAVLAGAPEASETLARLERARAAGAQIAAGPIARTSADPAEIRKRLTAARLEVLDRVLALSGGAGPHGGHSRQEQ